MLGCVTANVLMSTRLIPLTSDSGLCWIRIFVQSHWLLFSRSSHDFLQQLLSHHPPTHLILIKQIFCNFVSSIFNGETSNCSHSQLSNLYLYYKLQISIWLKYCCAIVANNLLVQDDGFLHLCNILANKKW